MPKPQPRISFEYFPPAPRRAGWEIAAGHHARPERAQSRVLLGDLRRGRYHRGLNPGRGIGHARDGIDVAPHLSFGGMTRNAIGALVDTYVERHQPPGRLRGDMPRAWGRPQLVYAQSELVAFIRERTGDHFQIEVAAYPEIHPEAKSYDSDIRYLKTKLDAGPTAPLTQYFSTWRPSYLDQCAAAGIHKPMYAGIMPIINFANWRAIFPQLRALKSHAGSASGGRLRR